MTIIENEDDKEEALAKIASIKQPEPGSEAEEELMQTVSAVAGYVAERDAEEPSG
jgi:hypothetical protein